MCFGSQNTKYYSIGIFIVNKSNIKFHYDKKKRPPTE